MKFDRRVSRPLYVIGALVCAGLLSYGYYLQYGQGLEPCPLCLVQRFFFYLVMGVLVIGALHGPRGSRWNAVYGTGVFVFAAAGAAAASRQVWLQHLPADKVPQCGPDLYFMLENFPLSRTLQSLIKGTGECAVVDWTFLGLSIAEWSLIWFVALAAYGVWLAVRASARRAAVA